MTRARALPLFVLAMTVVVAASNVLVQYPFEAFGMGEILTWGAFTYPVAFLVTDLTNRRYGKADARKVVAAGFVIAVILSIWLATPRIAIASGVAFLTAQLLDIQVFDRLRRQSWWRAPLAGTLFGSVFDTLLFFGIAFAPAFASLDWLSGREDGSLGFAVPFFGTEAPLWLTLAFGDFCVKLVMGLLMLVPYGALLNRIRPAPALQA